jgi:hypothetical protein
MKLNTTREERTEWKRQCHGTEENDEPEMEACDVVGYGLFDMVIEDCNTLEDRVAELERELAWVRDESHIRAWSFRSMLGWFVPTETALRHLASKPPADWGKA